MFAARLCIDTLNLYAVRYRLANMLRENFEVENQSQWAPTRSRLWCSALIAFSVLYLIPHYLRFHWMFRNKPLILCGPSTAGHIQEC
jgi:hypothetical protein